MVDGVGLLACGAGCGTSSQSGDPTIRQPLPAFNQNDPAAAKESFEKVVKADPNNKYGWYDLGVEWMHDKLDSTSDGINRRSTDGNQLSLSALYHF